MTMILNSELSWRQAFFYLLLSIIIYATTVSSSPSQISYHDHCSSIVPESPPTPSRLPTLLFGGKENGFCLGGDRILGQEYSSDYYKRLALQTRNIYRTEDDGVFMVEGSMNLQSSNKYYYGEDLREEGNSLSGVFPTSFWGGSVTFLLQGFWSESSGKFCMVGTGSAYTREGEVLDLAAVLKLYNVKNLSTVTDLVNGSLESLNLASDPNYFEPISIFVLPQLNYKYSLVSEVESNFGFCSMLDRLDNWFELEYPNDCYPSQNCSPFGGEIGHEYLPNFINLRASQCTEDEQRLQIIIKFHNFSYVGYNQLPSPNMILVGEGWCDEKNNLISIVACPILNTKEPVADARIGDCSIRLSLEFPSIWSIRSRNGYVGKIWSKKTVDDSGYFNMIMFKSPEDMALEIPGLKYEYTEIYRAGKLCRKKNSAGDNGERYPNPKESCDMQFDLVVKNSNGVMGWGSAIPLFVGDNLYDPFEYGTVVESKDRQIIRPVNISYKISFRLEHGAEFGDISAEGIYDAKTGGLCMVGCRSLSSRIRIPKNDSMDCEILVNFQFPPLGSKKEVHINGSIESTRERSDPLYFNSLDLSSSSSTEAEKGRSIGTMEMGIITMVVISNTLTCFLIGLQLLHVKNNPLVLPSISLLMLVILNFGFIIPLGMNFEALFLGSSNNQNLWLDRGRWFKLNNLVMLAAFLLHFWLLRLTWSARLSHGRKKSLWMAAEKKAIYLSLPLYIAGCLISFFLNCNQKNPLMTSQLHYLPRDLRSCSGLVLDWFLLPQILNNLFTNSREKSLSGAFYIGTTLIRLLPHAYEFYSGAGFYSAAWNAIVSCGSLMFCMVLLLQQKSGGSCILPKRFKGQKYIQNVGLSSST